MENESFLQKLNIQLEGISEESILINNKDLILFIINVENLFQNYELYEYLSNNKHDLEKKNLLFSSRFINSITINEKKIIIKKLFLAFYFYFEENYSINYISKINVSKLIYKKKNIYLIIQEKLIQLFFSKIFNENDILMFLKFIFKLGKSTYAFYILKNIVIIIKGNHLIFNKILEDICSFIKSEKIVIQKYKITNILFFIINNIELNENNKNNIINILLNINLLRYDKTLFENLIQSTLFHFEKIGNKASILKKNNLNINHSLFALNIQINFLNQLFQKEYKKFYHDKYKLYSGFIFDKQLGSLKLKNIIEFGIEKSISIIFSFNFSKIVEKRINFLELSNENSKNPYFSIFTEKDSLYFSISQPKKNEFIFPNKNELTIKENITYLIIISISKGNPNKILIIINGTEYDFTSKYGKNFDYPFNFYNSKLNICKNKNIFNGTIGTIFLFNCALTKEIINIIFSFKGDYENIILCNENNEYNLRNDMKSKLSDFEKLNEFKLLEYLKVIISPKSFLIKGEKEHSYKENFYDIKSIRLYNRDIFIKGQVKNFLHLSKSIYNFLYFDGLKYLQLICEFYLQILNSDKIEKDYHIINQNILNLIQFLVLFINNVKNGFLYFEDCFLLKNQYLINNSFIDLSNEELNIESNELIFLFSLICEIIKSTQGDKSLLIEEISNILLLLLTINPNSQLVTSLILKIIFFLLDKNLYNNETKKVLPSVYIKIYSCIESRDVNLLKNSILNKIIEMNDFSNEYNKIIDIFLFKIIPFSNIYAKNEENKTEKSDILEHLMKKIIIKLKDIKISFLDLKFIYNILMHIYKNISKIKFEKKILKIETIEDEKDKTDRKTSEKTINLVFYEDKSEEFKIKGFILSGLKALQNITIQNDEYLNIIDNIKAIFIQFIQTLDQFDEKLFTILIAPQRLDFDEVKQIFINGKKSFLSFLSLLFQPMEFNKFQDLIEKEIFKINVNNINLNYFDEKFSYLFELIHNLTNDEIIKLDKNNPKTLIYIRNIISSFYISLLNDFTSPKIDESKKEIFKQILHSKNNLLIQYYCDYKIFNEEISNIFSKELICISKILIYYDNNPFIFELLYLLYSKFQSSTNENKKIVPEIFKIITSDLNSNISNKKEINEDNNISKNIINLVILFYKLLSRFKNLNLNNQNNVNNNLVQIFTLNSFLFSNNPILYSSTYYDIGENNFKYLMELISEIFIELYLLTGKANYVDFLKNNILKHPLNKESFFFEYDKKYIEENDKKGLFSILLSKNNNQKKEPRKLLTLHYYIKFTLYSLNQKKCDNLIKPVYETIKNILKKDVLNLLSNKSKLKNKLSLINPQNEKDKLYNKVFNYFYYEKNKLSNKPKDAEEYIKKKIIKNNNKYNYIKYFKYSYDKKGKIINDNNNFIFKISNTLQNQNKYDKTYYKSFNITRSPKNSLDLNENNVSDDNIFQEEEIDEYIHKFESEIIYKSFFNFKENILNSFHNFNVRKVFCKNIFAEYFKKYLYYNECFLELRKNYLKQFYYKQVNNNDPDCYLNYPTRIKNFFLCKNGIRIFLKPDLKYFNNKYFQISHNQTEINFEVNEQTNNLSLFKNKTKLNFDILNSKTFDSELITIECITQGTIFLTENYFIYKSLASQNQDERQSRNSNPDNSLNKVFSSFENDINKSKEIILYFRFEEIKSIYIKRYLYRYQSFELILSNCKIYYFNLLTPKNIEILISFLKNKKINIIQNLKDYFHNKNYSKRYLDNEISTFDYLLYINFFSSRSLNDLNQYYVFPWLSILDNNDSSVKLRDFKYPLSAQSESKRKAIISRFEGFEINNKNKYVNHFNSHYSASSFINFYLSRISPFNENNIKLQNGKYDDPNRAFYCITEILQILIQYNDNRELIPEFFYLGESYLNLNYNNYGKRIDNIYINNITFDNYFKGTGYNITNTFEFMIRYRKLLESSEVNKVINLWIDNIFGINQLNKKKEDCNLFNKNSYEQLINFEKIIDKYKKKQLTIEEMCSKIKNKTSFILNFGQTPVKLFDEKTKVRKENNNNSIITTRSRKISIRKKNISLEENELNIVIKNINQNPIIFFWYNNLLQKLYILSKVSFKGIILTIYDINLNENSEINESKNFSIINLRDITFNYFRCENKVKYIYNLTKSFTFLRYDEQKSIIIFSNHRNNSLVFYSNFTDDYSIILPSFPCSIISLSNEEIITGHIDGFIFHWIIQINGKSINLKFKKKANVSNEPVLSISYNENIKIILVGNNKDCSVSIRNIYNFELISIIYLNTYNNYLNYLIIDQKINRFNYFTYIISFDMEKYDLHCYTVNGIRVCKKLENICKCFFIFNNGNILTYSYSKKGFIVCKGENLNKILFIKKLDFERDVLYFEFVEEKNIIYFIYQNNNATKNIEYLILTNEDMEQIYKEEYFIEIKSNTKKDLCNDIHEDDGLNDINYKSITCHSENTQSSSV